MSKLIIGIHGLANKPEKSVLEQAWRQSIAEGLEYAGAPGAEFDFDLVYWSDLLYRFPKHRDEGFEFDPLYNDEPYVPAQTRPKRCKEGWKFKLRGEIGEALGPGLDWIKQKMGVEAFADRVLAAKLKDLDYYYQERPVKGPDGNRQSAKTALRQRLVDCLDRHQDRDILLIAHSMGTIIAYDVLRVLGNEGHAARIQHFVTIGSPLGLPHVKQKIVEERLDEGRPEAAIPRTPTLVTGSWINYADHRDPVALDTHLGDDYKPNAAKVQVVDDRVCNEYLSPAGKANHHKSYGYLRVPELSDQIKKFLAA